MTANHCGLMLNEKPVGRKANGLIICGWSVSLLESYLPPDLTW